MKPQFQGIDVTYKSKADNKDIRDLLERLVPEAKKQLKDFAPQFKGNSRQETCKKIFDYIKSNIRYVADGDEQVIKLPSALLKKAVGDCKSYSLFTAGILENLGIPYSFVYASYNDNPIPHHVYVQTDDGCIIDVVYGKFNQEKKAKYKYKKHMNVRYMAGLGDCGCDHKGMGLTLISKEKRQAIKEDVKGAVKKVGEKAKDVVSDIKDVAKVVVQKGKTAMPLAVASRGIFIAMVKNNYDGIASKLSLDDYTDFLNSWYKVGGNRTTMTQAIKEGASKPAKKLGFLPKLKKILNVQGIGADESISTAQKGAIITLCATVGALLTKEPATGTAIGTTFGTIVVALAPALKKALKRVPDSESDNLVEPTESINIENDGGSDLANRSSSLLSKNLPLILGGLAVVGAGIYFATKKK